MLLCALMEVEEAKAKAAQDGAVEVVVATLRGHPAHSGVQQHGCAALRSLSASADNKARRGAVRPDQQGALRAARRPGPSLAPQPRAWTPQRAAGRGRCASLARGGSRRW